MIRRRPHVVSVQAHDDAAIPWGAWPTTVPAAREVLEHGLGLAAGVTYLVGENGSGRSTLVGRPAWDRCFPSG